MPEELAGWWRLAGEYSEGHVRRLIDAVRDPDRARQLTTLLQDTCDEIRYGDGGARLDFTPVAACVALGEVGFEEAIPVLFDVGFGGFEASRPLDTAATWAQRLGAPAFRRVISLIGDPFERSFGYTVLEAALDADEETRQRTVDFCLDRAGIEGRSPEEREWGCWPALAACATLVALGQERVRPTIEWWLQQDDCDVPQEHWNELLIELDGHALGERSCPWREPWPDTCRHMAMEIKEQGVTPATKAAPSATNVSGRRQAPKVGRNAPCPCGSGKKYKKCCLK